MLSSKGEALPLEQASPLLDAVATHFHATATWPDADELQRRLARAGEEWDVYEELSRVGAKLAHLWSGDTKSISLTVRGLAMTSDGRQDLELLVRAVEVFVSRYLGDDDVPEVTESQLRQNLGLDDLGVVKTTALIEQFSFITGGGGTRESVGRFWVVGRTTSRFKDVRSVDGLLRVLDEIETPNRVPTPRPSMSLLAPSALTHIGLQAEHHPDNRQWADSRPNMAARSVTPGEGKRLTVNFIGVDQGYLGDFTHGELDRFYVRHDLDIDIEAYEGTTRQRFIDILLNMPPSSQARILRGVVDRFPVGEGPATRTTELRDWVLRIADRCDGHMVEASVPSGATEAVQRALADAETLLGTSGATNALDRVHTALHGYLRAACETANIALKSDDPSTAALWAALRDRHPRLQPSGPRAQDVQMMLRAVASIVDVLSPIRNRASLADPNDELLAPEEALLGINAARTVLSYIESKLRLTGSTHV